VLLDCCNGNGSRSRGALEKLSKALAAVAHDFAQLKLDIAKLDARVAVIDTQVAAVHRRLDTPLLREGDNARGRDLDLEREVFRRVQSTQKTDAREEDYVQQ
jgi:hypothetical protein